AQISADDLDRLLRTALQRVEESRLRPRGVAHEGADVGSFVDQPFDEVAPDETSGPGDEHLAPLPVRFAQGLSPPARWCSYCRRARPERPLLRSLGQAGTASISTRR